MTASNYYEVAILNVLRGTTLTGITCYAKLHIGDPGEDGTANAATETTRKAITFNAPTSGAGTMTNSVALLWSSVAATETYTYLSFWDASSGGNCIGASTSFTGGSVTAGNNFQIDIGSITVTAA